MSPFERWMMKRIIRKEVRQGWDHDHRITSLFKMIIDAAKEEFTEDNDATRRHYLTEWFEKAFQR